MRKSLKLSGWIIILLSPASAAAQSPFPPVYVGGETDNPDMQACSTTYASAISAVEAAFRYNHVTIGTRSDYINSRAIKAYVNVNVMPLRYTSGEYSGVCAASVELSLEGSTTVTNPVTGTRHFAPVIYCTRGVLLTNSTLATQRRINENLSDYVNQCVAEYNTTLEP